jgi:hypothetical protein
MDSLISRLKIEWTGALTGRTLTDDLLLHRDGIIDGLIVHIMWLLLYVSMS